MKATIKLSQHEIKQLILEHIERNGYKRANQQCKGVEAVQLEVHETQQSYQITASIEVISKSLPGITTEKQDG